MTSEVFFYLAETYRGCYFSSEQRFRFIKM